MSEQHILSSLNYIPADIHCAQDYEWLGQRFIAKPAYEYIAGGSGHDVTVAANRNAFDKRSICPRLLRDVTQGHTRISLFNREYSHPVFLAPVAFQKLAHPMGELETARAAALMQTCMVSSTLSTYSLEEVAGVAGRGHWFQLYFQPKREVTFDLLKRAEAAGYGAIVLTLDASIRTSSLRSLRVQFQMPPECIAVNLQDYPEQDIVELSANESRIFQGMMREAPVWEDLEWLLTQTSLPVLVKGVLHPDDASALKAMGVAGIIVSNHGGRSLDGAPASLECLAAIRSAVSDDYPVLLDSGIRSGADIFKAIALGADAIMIGRLQMYALSVAGALGVAHMIKLLREELELCMALAGCSSLADIRKTLVNPQNN